MDYFKATEQYLYNYRSIKISLITLEKQLQEVKSEFKGIGAVNTKRESLSKTNKLVSITEEEVLERAQKIEQLERELNREKKLVEQIDRAIALLPDLERTVMQIKYLSGNNVSWIQVAEKVRYSVDHCKGKVRRKAIKKISVALFGLKALERFPSSPLCIESNG